MRYVPLFLLLILIPFSVHAQAPEIGRIGLYVDAERTTNEVTLPTPYMPFEFYVFCQPSANGMNCAEFGLDWPANWISIVMPEYHPDISVRLGELPAGLSACFTGCRTDWVWVAHLTLMPVTYLEPGEATIARNELSGMYQFASCLPGSPTEPVFFSPPLCMNRSCPPDETPPSPFSVTVTDDTHLTLHFDEPVFEPDAESAASYLVYPGEAAEDSIAVIWTQLQSDESSVAMRLGSPITAALYTLEVRNVRDIAGNGTPAGTMIAFPGRDTTLPMLVNAWAPDSATVMLTYSEQMSEGPAEWVNNYTIEPSDGGAPIPVGGAVLQPDGVTCVLSLSGPLLPEVIYEVTALNVTDLSGNPIQSGFNIRYFKAPDSWPPYITGIAMMEYSTIKVTFNEAVDLATACDTGNYSVLRLDPAGPPVGIVGAVPIGDQKVRLEPDTLLLTGLYALCAAGVSDTSMNVMLPDTVSFAVNDTIPPALLGAQAPFANVVEASFSETLDEASAEDKTHYSIYPSGDPAAPEAIDHAELLADQTTVRIYLEEDLQSGVVFTLKASGVRDIAGNGSGTQYAEFIFADEVPPYIGSIFLINFSQVQLVFSEPVLGGVDLPGNYLLYETSDPAHTVGIESAVQTPGPDLVTLTTADPLTSGLSYSLKIHDVLDIAGNPCDPDTVYLFDAVDLVPPSLVAASTISDSVVVLEFSEPLDPVVDGAVDRFFVFEYDDPPSILPLVSAALEPSQTTVRLVTGMKGYVGLAYRAEVDSIPDLAGNMFSGLSGAFYFTDDIPPELLGAEAVAGGRVIAHFSEQIATAPVSGFLLYETADSLSGVPILSRSLSTDRLSVTLTLGELMMSGTQYTLRVSDVYDMHGNPIPPGSETQFVFLDESPPELVSALAITGSYIRATFDETLDPATAGDVANYLVYRSSDPGDEIAVESAVAGQSSVDLYLAGGMESYIQYTLRADGVEDLFGNPCVDQTVGLVFRDSGEPAMVGLWADGSRISNSVEVPPYTMFRIYFWAQGGGDGVFGVEYSLNFSPVYAMIGLTLNPAIASLQLGEPYSGHSVVLTDCQYPWAWTHYMDCIMLSDIEDVVLILPHPATGLVQVATCLAGHPLAVPSVISMLSLNGDIPIATLLESWEASYRTGGIEVGWTLSDTGTVPGFSVTRLEGEGSVGQPVPDDLVSRTDLTFTLFDSSIEYGRTYRYRIEYEDEGERRVLFETQPVETPLLPLTLRQNRPNPFNPSTRISFFLPSAGEVRLEIYDVQGRLVRRLGEGPFGAGDHEVSWDGLDRAGRPVDSGVYFYRLQYGKEQISRKMVLLR